MTPKGPKKKRIYMSLATRVILGVVFLTLFLSAVSLLTGSRIHSIRQARQYETDTWQLASTIALTATQTDILKYIGQVSTIYQHIPGELMQDMDEQWALINSNADGGEEKESSDQAIQAYFEDLNKYNSYFDKLDTPAYYETGKFLPRMALENDIYIINIFVADPVRENRICVFYATQSPGRDFIIDTAGDISTFPEGFGDYIRSGSRDRFSFSYGTPGEETALFTSIAPVYHPDSEEIIAYVEVIDSYERVADDSESFIRQYLLTIFLAAGLLALIAYLITLKILVNPIGEMSRAANAYTTDTAHSQAALPAGDYFSGLNIRTGDEIESLAQAMKRMEQELSSYVDRLTAVTARTERIHTELAIASEIQDALLPKTFPPFPDHHEFDLYASMVPAREVGGDFYDLYLIDEDHLALTIADVSGKGVPAALFMALSKTMLKDRTLLGGSPSAILHDVNLRLIEGNDSNMFCTVWLGILTLSTGELICANAGHENPALRRSGEPFAPLVTRHGPILGALDFVTYKDETCHLGHGDTLFLYTDGLTEAMAPGSSMFTEKRLIYTLNQLDADDTPQQIIGKVHGRITDFMQGEPQYDDMTALCLTYFGKD